MDAINTWADLDVLQSFLDRRVVVGIGDLVKQQVDAIVNAANARLLGGGGVDGAIHEAGGPRILKECRAIRESRFPQGLPTGQVVITTGGLLPVRHVIHTVGPIFGSHQGRESELLAACYQNSLAVAVEHRLRHVAFPAISTGAFCYPPHEAAAVSSRAVAEFLAGDTSLEQVRFVFLFQEEAEVFLHHHRFPE
jgi:O-acetyl-ADP-ribose deacetylase (regulator of RNase III)